MTVTRAAIRVLCYGLALGVLAVAVTLIPRDAFADTQVTPQQILPLGANQCAPITVSNFTPYVYSNAVNSFDFSVSDPSYVTITASVGQTAIPLNFMRRSIDTAGVLHMHVDTPSIPAGSSIPVTVTMLSSPRVGSPVCAAVVTFMVQGSGAPVPATPTYPSIPSVPTTPTTSQQTPHATSSSSGSSSLPTGASASSSALGVIKNPLTALCATADSAYVLWIVLLVLYVLFVIGIAWPTWPANLQKMRTMEWRLTGILLPLVLLLALWYFSQACRGAGWMPIAAVLVAIAGTFAVVREKKPMRQLLLIDQKEVPKDVKKK